MTRTASQKRRAKQARGKIVNKARNSQRSQKPNVNIVVRRPRSRPIVRAGLSKCAYDYLSVLENPFSGKVACVPSAFTFPSNKVSSYVRGSFSTGVNNVGAVMANPWAATLNSSQTSLDAQLSAAVVFTTAEYSGTGFPTNTTPLATGVQGGNTNSPYAPNLNGIQCQVRVVACGLRIRNTTPMLNRGGSCMGVETMNHTSCSGISAVSTGSHPSAAMLDTSDGKWHSVVFHPEDPHDIEWTNGAFLSGYNARDFSQYFNHPLGFIVTSAAGVVQTFDYECYIVFEAKGSAISTATRSESDPIGFAIVENMTSPVEMHKPKVGDRQGWIEAIMNYPGSVAAITALGGAAANYNTIRNRILGPDYTTL